MKILIYILEYLVVGLVSAWGWNRMRVERGKEQCMFYSVLDTLLWPVVWIMYIVGFVEGFIEAITTIMKGS